MGAPLLWRRRCFARSRSPQGGVAEDARFAKQMEPFRRQGQLHSKPQACVTNSIAARRQCVHLGLFSLAFFGSIFDRPLFSVIISDCRPLLAKPFRGRCLCKGRFFCLLFSKHHASPPTSSTSSSNQSPSSAYRLHSSRTMSEGLYFLSSTCNAVISLI